MGIAELFVLAVGLSMDAFAVSVCKGLSLGKITAKHMGIAGLWFGGFQALMPAVGYFLGSFFTDMITRYANWIAFGLLLFLGAGMVKEAFEKAEETVRLGMAASAGAVTAIGTKPPSMALVEELMGRVIFTQL